MHTRRVGLIFCLIAAVAPATAQNAGNRRQPPTEALSIEEVLNSETHVLFFERVFLAAAQGITELRPTDFQIGQRNQVRTRTEMWSSVQVQFRKGEGAAERPWAFWQKALASVESMGDTNWRVGELYMRRSSAKPGEDESAEPSWSVDRLRFAEYDEPQLQVGTRLMAGLKTLFDQLASGRSGVARPYSITLQYAPRSTAVTHRVQLEIDFVGDGFRKSYARMLTLLAKSMQQEDSVFDAFIETSGESILQDGSGARYRVSLSVRPKSAENDR